jgi:hypothetical protein
MTSSPKISPHSSKPLLEVSTVEACSYRRAINWKKSMAPVRVTGSEGRSSIADRVRKPAAAPHVLHMPRMRSMKFLPSTGAVLSVLLWVGLPLAAQQASARPTHAPDFVARIDAIFAGDAVRGLRFERITPR